MVENRAPGNDTVLRLNVNKTGMPSRTVEEDVIDQWDDSVDDYGRDYKSRVYNMTVLG